MGVQLDRHPPGPTALFLSDLAGSCPKDPKAVNPPGWGLGGEQLAQLP